MTGVLLATLAVSGSATSASACSTQGNHCYGTVSTSPTAIDGIVANIDPTCQYININDFITSEVWLVSSSGSYWVEVGYIYVHGPAINGLGQGLAGFWGDRRPVDGMFFGHEIVDNPALINRSASVQRQTSNSFLVNFGGLHAISTNNTMTVGRGDVGSETTSNYGPGSLSRYTLMAYRAGTWSGQLAAPIALSVDPPQTQAWTTQSSNMWAGVPC